MVGIKGTGMAALAEILVARGLSVTGSDVAERFYTDRILQNAGIAYIEGFDAANLPDDVDVVVYSSAYDRSIHPELVEASRRSILCIEYTEALGAISREAFSVGVSGVHGKTTTTALVAALVRAHQSPGTVLAGSALADVGGRSTLIQGRDFLVAETCEYRRHFLRFAPAAVVITNVEADHLDYFADAADVEAAFVEYARLLPRSGTLIACADDPGAARVVDAVIRERPDLRIVRYGASAAGPYRIAVTSRASGMIGFTVGDLELELHVPGDHNALNTAAAIAAFDTLPGVTRDADLTRRAIAGFSGTRRRSEVVGTRNGVTVVDDYAHHPTAIVTTLAGLRSFYPGRRLVLSFMSHTYTRTVRLLDELADALTGADELVLHDIYASARESRPDGVDGRILVDAARARGVDARYVPDPIAALPMLDELLRPGDLFVTMGAGNNWELAHEWVAAGSMAVGGGGQ
ncbi:MAG: UDP-N-acetylmuramate--L-alanine ligase [Spirochaetaceae bacterium]|nr:MAG: UDP-N-acetylmuramate--L-alanine ligase [Spirochaetaceae bacterium]